MADLPRGHHFMLQDYRGGRDKTFTTKAAALSWLAMQPDKKKWELYEFMYGKGDYYKKRVIPSASTKVTRGRRC